LPVWQSSTSPPIVLISIILFHCAGLTAWFRSITEVDKGTARDFFRERLPGVTVVELEGAEEGMFEAAAVNYAADKCGIGRPDLQLAAGGGYC